jgi:hypothetical protein
MELTNLFANYRRYNRFRSELATSESNHSLSYRGTTYKLPKYASCQTLDTIGKQLIYRGATYIIEAGKEIMPSRPKIGPRLIYRGLTYGIAER